MPPLPPAAEISKDHIGPIGREQVMLSDTVLTVSAENWIQARVVEKFDENGFQNEGCVRLGRGRISAAPE